MLSDSSVGARVYALMNVLKGVAEIEMLCLNSRETSREQKFLRKRAEEERNPVVRRLLERDQNFLDRIQVQMATAREFLIIIRLHNEKGTEVFSYLDRIEKSLKEQGFSASRAGSEDIKRIMAVYYEQNVTSEKFEDFDGERWIIPTIKGKIVGYYPGKSVVYSGKKGQKGGQPMDYQELVRKRDAYQEGKHLIPELTIASYERAFEIEYTHHSTAIEGNTLTLMETKLVLEDRISVGGKRLRELLRADKP